MKTGIGLTFVCVGAILAFAVTTNTSVFNLHTAGWVILLVGVIGLLLPRRTYPAGTSRAAKVEEIPVPPYVAHNPGTSRIRAGLPTRPTLLDEPDVDPVEATVPGATVRPAAPGTTEVIEDLYEEE